LLSSNETKASHVHCNAGYIPKIPVPAPPFLLLRLHPDAELHTGKATDANEICTRNWHRTGISQMRVMEKQ
jgi:hypothetical protein